MTDLQRQLRDSLSVARVAAVMHEQVTDLVPYDRTRRAATWALQALDARSAAAAQLRLAQALVLTEDRHPPGKEPRSFESLSDTSKVEYLQCASVLLNHYHAALEGFTPLSAGEAAMLARLEAKRLSYTVPEAERLSAGVQS